MMAVYCLTTSRHVAFALSALVAADGGATDE